MKIQIRNKAVAILSFALLGSACSTLKPSISAPVNKSSATILTPSFRELKRSEWKPIATNYDNALSTQCRIQNAIKYVTIHHTDGWKEHANTNESQLVRNFTSGHIQNKKFGDVAYHYIVGKSGTIYQGRAENRAPASNTHYYSPTELVNANWYKGRVRPTRSTGRAKPGSSQGHLTVALMCGHEKDELLSKHAMQVAAYKVAVLLKENNLKPEDVRAHREVASSECPGDPIYKWLRGSSMKHNGEGEGMRLIKVYFANM